MDKAARLIRLQRSTILMLFATVITSFMAHEAREQEDLWRSEVGYADDEIGDLERRHAKDQRIIQDQNDRLQKLRRQPCMTCGTIPATSAQ